MSRTGNYYDNACIEAVYCVLKKDWIFHEKYYKTPIAYEKEYYKQKNAS